MKKIDECKNSPENSFTTKVAKHTISSFNSIENKHDVKDIDVKIV